MSSRITTLTDSYSSSDKPGSIWGLAALCEHEGRVLELVRLRTRELDLAVDPERRLALRLEISRLVGVLEQQGGRVDALRRNLAESPGRPLPERTGGLRSSRRPRPC